MTRGHPDGIARFINESTIAVGETLDKTDADYPVFEDAASVASEAGFSLVRVPIPGRWEEMAANYMNWYVANGVVLVGTFGRPEFDDIGIASVAALFPERKVVGIDVRRLWRRGGGLHCVTQQQPKS
jgi:agmatine deiminase